MAGAMSMLYLTPSVNIAHTQTTNQSSTSNNIPIEGKVTA